MRVSGYCFNDTELSQFIDSSLTIGNCDFTHRHAPVIDLNDLMDFFEELVGVFEVNADAEQSMIDIIQSDWNLFASEDIANAIMSEVLRNIGSALTINSMVVYNHEIQEVLTQWEKVKKSLKEEKRFFTDIDEFATGARLLSEFIKDTQDLAAGNLFYRARLITQGKSYYQKKDMGCPPKDKTTAGRANPIGIPYLYLSQDVETTFYEIRASYLDHLSVGKFLIQRNLKMVDFTRTWSLYLLFINNSIEEAVIQMKLFSAFSADLSKPLRRYDTEIEYVPTQYLCEYCKTLGADAICFNSSLHTQGINYVLFNPEDAECVEVKKHTIKKVILDDRT